MDSITGEPCSIQPSAPKDVTPPKPIYQPEPDYTDSARKALVSGGARVLLLVGEDGNVKRACLVQAVQTDLGEEALKTARSWRFQPATKDGAPISYTVSAEFTFNLYPWRME